MARQGYTTVEDLADRWDSPEEARNHGPRDLDFTDSNHGFTAQSSAFTAMRLLQAVRAARMIATIPGTGHTQGTLTRSTSPGGIIPGNLTGQTYPGGDVHEDLQGE